MHRIIYVLLLLSVRAVAAESFTLTSEDWARRSAEAFTQQPVLANVQQAFEKESDGVIVITHATSEAGQLWAEELRAWWVAFGVSSTRVRLEAHPEINTNLRLTVRKRADL